MGTSIRTPSQSPVSFNITPAGLLNEAEALNAESTAVIHAIVASADTEAPTFESSIQAFIDNENKRLAQSKPLRFHSSTNPDKAIREASTTASKILTDHDLELFHNEKFVAIVQAVWKRRDKMDTEARYYIEKLYASFEEKGSFIKEPAKRDQFRSLQTKIGDLKRTGTKNLNDDTSGLWFGKADLQGLPEHVLRRFKKEGSSTANKEPNAAERIVSEGAEEASYWVTMKPPDVMAAQTNVTNQMTRRTVTRAFANRCPQNIPIYREIYILRDEAARLMGFDNHAAFRINYKMLRNAHIVKEFLDSVTRQLRPARDADLKRVREMKEQDMKAQGVDKTQRGLLTSDTLFYSRLVKEKLFSYRQQDIVEYFELDRTMLGLFSIYERILGINFSQTTPEPGWTWHSSVKMYTLWDNDRTPGEFLGYLYLDLFPRDGKFTHAGHYSLVPGFTTRDGLRHYPSGALVLNLTPYTPHNPSLLSHEELRRLFHELGHAMHNLLSKTRHARFHGTAVDGDFVEAPSMMFEFFLWTPEIMRDLSCHYSYIKEEYRVDWERDKSDETRQQPPEKIPENIIEGLVASKNVNRSRSELEKAWMATYDLRVHSPKGHEEIEKLDHSKVWYDLRTEIMGIQDFNEVDAGEKEEKEKEKGVPNMGHGWSGFRLIMGKYDAGYYTYLLCVGLSPNSLNLNKTIC